MLGGAAGHRPLVVRAEGVVLADEAVGTTPIARGDRQAATIDRVDHRSAGAGGQCLQLAVQRGNALRVGRCQRGLQVRVLRQHEGQRAMLVEIAPQRGDVELGGRQRTLGHRRGGLAMRRPFDQPQHRDGQRQHRQHRQRDARSAARRQGPAYGRVVRRQGGGGRLGHRRGVGGSGGPLNGLVDALRVAISGCVRQRLCGFPYNRPEFYVDFRSSASEADAASRFFL